MMGKQHRQNCTRHSLKLVSPTQTPFKEPIIKHRIDAKPFGEGLIGTDKSVKAQNEIS